MRGSRLFLIVLVIATLLVSLIGCFKKDDQSPDERSAARTSAGGILLKNVLASWEAGNKDDAVKQFVSITWTDPSVLEDMPILSMSEKQFVALPQDDRTRIQQEALELTRNLRSLVMHVLSIGDDHAASGDTKTAKKHYGAVRDCGHTLSGRERLLIIQRFGKLAAAKASQSASQ